MSRKNITQWTAKYKPSSVEQMVLSDDNKSRLQSLISNRLNATLYGPPGTIKDIVSNYLADRGMIIPK